MVRQAKRMWTRLANLVRDDRGQDLAEYGIAVAVIVIGVVMIAVAIGTDVNSLWSNAQQIVQSVVDSEP